MIIHTLCILYNIYSKMKNTLTIAGIVLWLVSTEAKNIENRTQWYLSDSLKIENRNNPRSTDNLVKYISTENSIDTMSIQEIERFVSERIKELKKTNNTENKNIVVDLLQKDSSKEEQLSHTLSHFIIWHKDNIKQFHQGMISREEFDKIIRNDKEIQNISNLYSIKDQRYNENMIAISMLIGIIVYWLISLAASFGARLFPESDLTDDREEEEGIEYDDIMW